MAQAKNKECHVMPHPNLDDLHEMRTHPETRVIEQTGLNIGYLAYNVKKPPFNKVHVRQAINKQAILEMGLSRHGHQRRQLNSTHHVVLQP
jgi:dipeptide transport system substrate-binding protein